MKNKQRGDAVIAFMGLIIVLVIAVVCWIDSISCSSRWEDSGFETKWGPIKGCIVHTPSGRWLPDDVIREVDLKEAAK